MIEIGLNNLLDAETNQFGYGIKGVSFNLNKH